MSGNPPAWNDPPPLSYLQTDPPGGKRNLLNKRVPFPLNQSTSPSQKATEKCNNEVLSLTSAVSPDFDKNNATLQKESSEELNINLTDEEKLSTIINIFETILLQNSEKYEKKQLDEINQRITMMKDSWGSKLSLPVKNKMFILAEELSNGNADSALKIQCALMVDYLREVKQWMVGVKHLIEMERQRIPSEKI